LGNGTPGTVVLLPDCRGLHGALNTRIDAMEANQVRRDESFSADIRELRDAVLRNGGAA
jgi:hypothetical protein